MFGQELRLDMVEEGDYIFIKIYCYNKELTLPQCGNKSCEVKQFLEIILARFETEIAMTVDN